jgi:TP901 family phage tail tape measure protein
VALSGREVMLVLRARDEASRTLRRLSRSLNQMEREDHARASRGLALAQQNMTTLGRTKRDIQDAHRMQMANLAHQYRATNMSTEAYQKQRAAQIQAHMSAMRGFEERRRSLEDEMASHRRNIAQIEEKEAAIRQQGYSFMDAGAALTTFGVALTGVGIVGAIAMKKTIDATMDYRQAVSLTMTQVDEAAGATFGRVAKLGKEIAGTIPVAFDEIQPALYDIFSSIDTNMRGASTLLKQFSRDAVGGQTELATATRANLAIMNAYKLEVKDAAQVSDFMFQLVRKGVGTYEEFANVIGRSIPSAARAGQSYQMLGGMLAFMTRNGLSTAMASTSAARALDALSHPETVKRMEAMGVSVRDAKGEFLPLPRILAGLNKEFDHLAAPERAKALYELFKSSGGTIQARRFFDMYFKNSKEFEERVREMGAAAGASGDAFNRMADTPRAKFQQLSNLLRIASIELGGKLLPAVLVVVDALNNLMGAFDSLSPGVKRFIAYTLGIGTALSLIVGIVSVVAGGFMMLKGALMLAFSGALQSVTVFLGLMTGIGVVIAGVIAGAYLLWKNWDTVGDNIMGVLDGIGSAIEQTFGPMFETIMTRVQRGWQDFTGSLEEAWGVLQDLFKGDTFGGFVDDVTELGRSTMDVLRPAFEAVGDVLGGSVQFGLKVVGELIVAFVQAISGAVQLLAPLVDLFSKLPGPVQGSVVALTALAIAGSKVGPAMAAAAASSSGMVGALGRMRMARNAALGLGAVTLALGGMADQSSTTQKVLGGLAQVAGGALMGFAVGGPWGAALGAGAGALSVLAQNTSAAGDSAVPATQKYNDFAATLDKLTGAATLATRELALQRLQNDLWEGKTVDATKAAAQFGISQRDMVGAVTGNENALRRVETTLGAVEQKYKDMLKAGEITPGMLQYDPVWQALQQVKNAVTGVTTSLTKQQKAARDAALATQDLADIFGKVPKKFITELETKGVPQTLAGVQRLRNEYKLTPKAVRTLVELMGINPTKRQLDLLQKGIKGVPKKVETKLALTNFTPSFKQMQKMTKEYKLTPKQVRTIVKATGVEFTQKQMQKLVGKVKEVDKSKANPQVGPPKDKISGPLRGFIKLLTNFGKQDAKPQVGPPIDKFNKPLKDAWDNLDKFGKDKANPSLGLLDGVFKKLLGTANNMLSAIGRRSVSPTVGLTNNASGGIQTINSQLNSLAARPPVTVSANFTTTRTTINRTVKAATGGQIVNGALRLASGGPVFGPGGPTADRVPAMLSNGEFVVNARQTADNLALISAINNGLDVDIHALRAAREGVRMARGGRAGGGGGGGGRGGRGGRNDRENDKAAKKRNQLLTKVVKALEDLNEKASPKQQAEALLKGMGIKRTGARVQKAERVVKGEKFDRLDKAIIELRTRKKELQSARDELQRLKDERQSLVDQTRSTILEFGNISNFVDAQDIFGNPLPPSPAGISTGLQQRLQTVKDFGNNLKALLKMGFSKDVYDQVLAMGPENGALFSKALLQSTPTQMRDINNTLADFQPAIRDLNQTTNQLHQIGIDAADGLVRGLEKKVKAAEKAAHKLASVIVNELRRVLKIGSPSKVGMDIANNLGGTLHTNLALWESPLRRVSARLGESMIPTYASSQAVGGGSAGAASVTNVNQDITINTSEIDPRRHAAELGWRLATRHR